MIAFFERIGEYLSFPFAQYVLIVGVLIALCASLLGVTLVLKRFSYIGDGLSHVAFGALSVAAVAGLTNQTLIVLPITVLAAILLLRGGQKTRIKGDASIALISVFSFAFGYLLMSIFSPKANFIADVCGALFGSDKILRLSPLEVWLCAGLSLCTVIVFVLFYNRIFTVTFDENFAKATGVKTEVYNLIIAVIIAVVIVFAMNLVGSLMISALIIFPALSAMRVFKSFLSVTIASIIFSIVSALLGILFSIGWSLPVGPTVVVVQAALFGGCSLAGFIRGKIKV